MELKIDLIPPIKKSKFALVLGIVSISLPILYLVFRFSGDQEKIFSLLPMMLLLMIQGINGILGGLGISMSKFFGSAYVLVDNEQIALKISIWTKVKSIPWSQIKSLEYKTNRFDIIQKDGTVSKLELSELEFKVLVETKDAIRTIAVEKAIPIH